MSERTFELDQNPVKWYQLILPRLFGRKMTSTDGGYRSTMYEWRGTFYMTEFRRAAIKYD